MNNVSQACTHGPRARSVCWGIYSGGPKRSTWQPWLHNQNSAFFFPHMGHHSYEMEQCSNCAIAAAILSSLWTPPPFALLPVICLHLLYHYCPLCWGLALRSGLVCACLTDITHCSIFLFNLICSICCCLYKYWGPYTRLPFIYSWHS